MKHSEDFPSIPQEEEDTSEFGLGDSSLGLKIGQSPEGDGEDNEDWGDEDEGGSDTDESSDDEDEV